MDCLNKKKNLERCNCSYSGCSKKGMCCDCLHYHKMSGQMPACFFPDKDEMEYDRSVANFVKIWQEQKHI